VQKASLPPFLALAAILLAGWIDGSTAALHAAETTQSQPIQTDVCVYGGTSAGVTAAIQTARMGKRCVLVQTEKRLGGLTSNGLGWTDVGSAEAVGGLAREFYHRIHRHYQDPAAWQHETRASYVRRAGLVPDEKRQIMFTFEPRIALAEMQRMLKEVAVTTIPGRIARPKGVIKENGRIRQLILEDGGVITADQYIDASYEGDLLAEAGVSYTVGREPSSQYGETLAGIQAGRAHKNQLPHGISPYRIPNQPDSGRLPGINADAGGTDGKGDGRLQAYCYRMCLTDVASNRVMIARPADYREEDFELLFRAIEAGQKSRFFKLSPMPNRKTDSNNDAGISTDFIGGNYDLKEGWNYAEADYARRAVVDELHRRYQMGLVWTLQNHPRVPAAIRRSWANWGMPRDEFTENGHWPPGIYVREARRMTGDFVVTEHHVHQEPGHVAHDPIGMGGYNVDSHHVQRHITPEGFVLNEGDVQLAPARGPYGISYQSIVPRRDEAENLLVPVCLSASHVAFGSIRMEPVFMILGQSAATAAVLAIEDKVPVQKVHYTKLAAALRRDGQILSLPSRSR
jgi:hypothetical protein